MRPSVTVIVSSLFLMYVAYSMYTIAVIFFPTHCEGGIQKCLEPYKFQDKGLEVCTATCLYYVLGKICMPPQAASTDLGHIVFGPSVCPFVCLSVKTFTLTISFDW